MCVLSIYLGWALDELVITVFSLAGWRKKGNYFYMTCIKTLFQMSYKFFLAGEPSLCYIYEGDGICEPFEKETSITDCGLYTPKGYLDQWATQAYSSHEDKKKCPVSLVTGEPPSMVS